MTDMLKLDRKENCCGCQACLQICPRGCIRMQEDEEGFWYPVVDRERCVQCGLCEKVCPLVHSSVQSAGEEPAAYAVRSLREEERLQSSSGGIFSLLARRVLEEEGAVYGAAMPQPDTVKHIRITQQEDLALLRGSKYVQSDLAESYLLAKEDLNRGKRVFFTGTPCQIEGLRSFLGRDDPNLITMDIVCHGVPSPKVWKAYLRHREDRAKSKARAVSFRNKRYGWKEYSVAMEFENGTKYTRSFFEDPYMRAYIHDLTLRPSCYQCAFKKKNRLSDLTAADFWGIGSVCPELDDDKGTSLVLVHSGKGERLLRSVSDQIQCRQVELHAAMQGNPALVNSSERPALREEFLKQLQCEPFPKAVDRYAKNRPTVKRRIKNLLRRMGMKR